MPVCCYDDVVYPPVPPKTLRQAQQELSQTAEKLQLAVDAAQMGIFEWNVHSDRVEWSPYHYQLYGYEPNEHPVDYEFWKKHVLPEDLEQELNAFETAKVTRTAWSNEFRIRRKDGQIRWLGVRGQFVYGANGGAVRGCGVVFDVTERKEQEDALRQSEAIALSRLAEIQTLYAASPVGLGFIDRSMRYVRVNDALAQINGVPPADHIGRTVEEVLGKEIWNMVKPTYHRVFKGETILNMEVEGVLPANPRHLRYFLVSYCPVRTAGGETLGAAISVQETTELRKAQEELRLSEARFRTAKTAAKLGIYDADIESETTEWDERMRELWGFDADTKVTREVALSRVHPEDRPALERAINHVFSSSGTKTFSAEYRVINAKDEKVRWIAATGIPLLKDGKPYRLVGTVKDVTDRKLFESELEHLVAERTASLREAIAQMEEFSYTVSHDLRAPLRALRVYAGVLLDNFSADLPEEAQQCLNRINVNANSLEKMVTDVLTFSKVARTDMPMKCVDTDVLVRRIVEQCPAIRQSRATILVELLPNVLGNEPSLLQAFSNLLSNAVKFVGPGVKPCVRVWSERNGGKLRFWISDNGIGIAPKYQHRLFSMFERIHPDTVYDGTGVGLAIVRKAVERMGGKVGVESDGINGSKFWIELQAPTPNEHTIEQLDLVS